MKASFLIIAGMLFCSIVTAKVYKWVDENGVTHYSQNKPDGKETTQIKVKGISDAEAKGASQNGATGTKLNCEKVVKHGLQLLKDKIKKSGSGPSPFDDMLNDPAFVQEGVDECLREKNDPVKAAQWLCQQNAKTFDEVEACEK